MQNKVRYPDNRFGDRLELLLATALAVAGLVVVVICLINFGQLVHEFKGSVIPAILKLRGGAPLFVPEASLVQINSTSNYKLPVRSIYKSYPGPTFAR
jgi:hypothetical protein